jgi:hypothetical protein
MRLNAVLLTCPLPHITDYKHHLADSFDGVRVKRGREMRTGKYNFNIKVMERFQSKTLRMIVDAPWYTSMLNTVIRRDLQTPTVKEEIRR